MTGLVSDVLGRTASAAKQSSTRAESETGSGTAGPEKSGPEKSGSGKSGPGESDTVVNWARRLGTGVVPDFVVDGDAIMANLDGNAVGSAVLLLEAVEPGVREVRLHVDPA